MLMRMRGATVMLACAGALLPGVAPAQTSEPALAPFTAHYSVHIDGRERGRSVLGLERGSGDTWRYTLRAEGTRGLARLASVEARQDTDFVFRDGSIRPQRAVSTRAALVGSRTIETVFDWTRGEVRWSGDVDADRRGPAPLGTHPVNGPLLNLALALDARTAQPGDTLHYSLLERGRADAVSYTVGHAEDLTTPLGTFAAIPLTSEQPEKHRVTTAWYAPGLPPTPLRVLRMEHGKPAFELRLIAIEPSPATPHRAGPRPP